MFLKKVLNQPNLVGTVMIALMVCSGFVYAFAFDGFNVETTTGGEVEAWLAQAGGGGSGETSCGCSRKLCPKTKCKKKNSCGSQPGCKDGCKGGDNCHKAPCPRRGDNICSGIKKCKGCC